MSQSSSKSGPGLYDPSQSDRLLRLPGNKLSFASFNPATASAWREALPDMNKLSLSEELYRPKRVVVEVTADGQSSWRFVPKAKRDPGAQDEGTWPRIVDLCGDLVEFDQDMWDIYKLDPEYICTVRPLPANTTITRNKGKGKAVEDDSGSKSSETLPANATGAKRRYATVSPNRQMPPPPPPLSSKRPRIIEISDDDSNSGLDSSDDNLGSSDEVEGMVRARTLSPTSIKRELAGKKAAREKEKKRKVELSRGTFSASRHAAFAKEEELPDVPEEQLENSEFSRIDADEEAARQAAIEESRRKIAELEQDRPLWDRAIRERERKERAEKEANEKERRRREEAERAAHERRERERVEHERRQALAREAESRQERQERERKRRHQWERWSRGPWTSQRALERYRILAEAFDNAKFSRDGEPLTFDAIPWPVLHSPVSFTVEDIDWSAVEKFFTEVRHLMRTQDYKEFVEKSHRRFHPDRWRGRRLFDAVVRETERGELEVAANTYHRYSEGHDIFSPRRQPDSTALYDGLAELEPARMRVVRDSGLSLGRHLPSPSRIPISPHRERTSATWARTAASGMMGEPDPLPDPYVPPADGAEPMPPNLPLYRRIMTFFGYGRYATKARKSLFSVVWTLSFGFVQVVIVVALLAYSSIARSHAMPQYTEWTACDRPLGVWNALWVGKILMGCSMGVWGFTRDKVARQNAAMQNALAMETGRAPSGAARTTARQSYASSGNNNSSESARPHARLYSRMSFLSSLLTVTWFVIAHILAYTSVNTCRHAAPHIWWLTFGILCTMYLAVVEVILFGLVVFVIGPLILLFYNIILILLGRHPLQNPHYIKPEIGKLPKSVVQRIPLVLYIPPPPDDDNEKVSPLAFPPPAYTYPPKTLQAESAVPARRRRRFAFLRKMTKSKVGKNAKGKQTSSSEKGAETEKNELTWEDNWEQGDYPFVILEENRAACAICLTDFEEPKRIRAITDGGDDKARGDGTDTAAIGKGGEDADAANRPVEELRVGEVTEEERANLLKLEDAGEGPQPLRLLGCGHVFHKTCLDPWLTDVSGRCPVCQRPVNLPEPEQQTKKDRRRRT
ncbi:hypothetical protein OE88DRAFT_1625140 [Heliocybe sulcata]|uniref:RING-type domain-containing protein n=1 Tax=Heliocybe sulcata TaxID=5364 RepID=A0A5C3NCS0_9AGAM|nr:hypothetical protein OE88DRAFT_1625140 [Heliocybe sulcata]